MQLSHTHCMNIYCIHCKKDSLFPVPKREVTIFSVRESLVSVIPPGDGNLANPFLQCSFEVHRHKFQTFVAVYNGMILLC